jgi:hypothetical protein
VALGIEHHLFPIPFKAVPAGWLFFPADDDRSDNGKDQIAEQQK